MDNPQFNSTDDLIEFAEEREYEHLTRLMEQVKEAVTWDGESYFINSQEVDIQNEYDSTFVSGVIFGHFLEKEFPSNDELDEIEVGDTFDEDD